MNFYNEFDPKAAAWLRELIKAGEIPDGFVDERSILEIKPHELESYAQCHFFAGIGGWSYALALAGWPSDRPVWTGSCPCQPFSAAGKGHGTADERHLWPAFYALIEAVKPPVIFGEQVASKSALSWLDGVFDDLEGTGYACGAADLCAAGVGAPHIRQRLYWVADTIHGGSQERWSQAGGALPEVAGRGSEAADFSAEATKPSGASGWMAHASSERRQQNSRGTSGDEAADGGAGWNGREPNGDHQPASDGTDSGVADTERERGRGWVAGQQDAGDARQSGQAGGSGRSGFWDDFTTIPCRDGKARRIPRPQPGVLSLADEFPDVLDALRAAGMAESEIEEILQGSPLAKCPGRVGLLRGFGNAIVPELAAEFVRAYLDVRSDVLKSDPMFQ